MATQTGSIDLAAARAAAGTATTYITDFGDDGITVHPEGETDSYSRIDADGMEVVADGTSVAQFGATARIGAASDVHVSIDSDSMDVEDGTDALASFGIVQDTNPRTGQAQDMQSMVLGDGFRIRTGYTEVTVGDETLTDVDTIIRSERTNAGEGATLHLSAKESASGATNSAYMMLAGTEASGEPIPHATVGAGGSGVSDHITVGYVDDGGYIGNGIQLSVAGNNSAMGVEFGTVSDTYQFAQLDAVPWRNALGIRAGSVAALGNTAGGAYKDKSVSFGTELGSAFEFVSPPAVVVGFKSDSSAGTFGRCCVSAHSVTTTGFTLRFFNGDSSNRNPEFFWIAIGTRASQL